MSNGCLKYPECGEYKVKLCADAIVSYHLIQTIKCDGNATPRIKASINGNIENRLDDDWLECDACCMSSRDTGGKFSMKLLELYRQVE